MNLDHGVADSNNVLQFPVGTIEKDGKIIPILNKEGFMETDRDELKNRVGAVLSTVEPDTLSLLNIGIGNQIREIAERAQKTLDYLHTSH